MDYEKKYNEALDRARNLMAMYPQDAPGYKEVFPELRESEDERIRKEIISIVKEYGRICEKEGDPCCTIGDCLTYLEKQKEPHYAKRNALFDKCVAECDPEIMQRVSDEIDEMLEKEQKPAEWSEEDEMVRNAILGFLNPDKGGTKYSSNAELVGWSNWLKSLRPHLSDEEIKKIRSEEYTKGFNDAAFGGQLKEWGAEDEDRIRQIERIAQQAGCTQKLQEEIHDWLKSLRPSWKPSEVCYGAKGDPDPAGVWKPSEEQKEALEYVIRDYREDSCNATANYLQEILDHLKNM